MKTIDLMYRTLYAELTQRAMDERFISEFSTRGRFVRVKVKDRDYWYFDLPGENGRQTRKYVGPDADPDIRSRVERFAELKADARQRRRFVTTLKREARLPGPEPFTGEIIEALARAGFFRLRGVLIGTVAYQCYPAYLGIHLPSTSMRTADADFAQFHSISVAIEDQTAPIGDVLRTVDPSFTEVMSPMDGRRHMMFRNRDGYKVEFLTPNTSSDDYQGQPATMPALGDTGAQPIRFLDFLIYQPVLVTLLHGSGVPILIPAPERFAVHKLIVAARRGTEDGGAAKREKDVMQALTLMEALIATRRAGDLADAFDEARERGEAWREALAKGLDMIEDRERLMAVVQALDAALKAIGAGPVMRDGASV
ncbi:hypothetical protein SAMN05880582_11313 [Rhizobium sp. RU20A]|uniref:nucleotidyltransferase family protein n=1 Tax=Rhizobium sp. RU20A TaxID=1907412 RepID=UPI0009556A68|nr:GSU2403 family nucleotidyltransferase fold protein [Rhizobium sp. RU20A]SIR42322.1 hypothetical protein SAMN05880582_11313 [Rhizobium sp. RU20A]